ncbi:MAG: hypothetical protein MK193_05545 [Lentisphaeria bacterium]|nr:hypothetical protein [Lentisphaeria bacterium]
MSEEKHNTFDPEESHQNGMDTIAGNEVFLDESPGELPDGPILEHRSSSEATRSGIFAMGRNRLMLYIISVFMFTTLMLPGWGALIMLILLLLTCIAIVVCLKKPELFPKPFKIATDNLITIFEKNPIELVGVPCMILIALLQFFCTKDLEYSIVEKIPIALGFALMGFVFWLNNRPLSYRSGQGGFFDFLRRKKSASVRVVTHSNRTEPLLQRQRQEGHISQEIQSDQKRANWERQQQLRWETWMEEEVERLNDDHD